MKQGQGLSITTIVVAALALLVLVVLTLIFTGRMNPFAKGVEDSNSCDTFCESIGQTAAPEGGCALAGLTEGSTKNIGDQTCTCCKPE